MEMLVHDEEVIRKFTSVRKDFLYCSVYFCIWNLISLYMSCELCGYTNIVQFCQREVFTMEYMNYCIVYRVVAS